MVKIHTYMYLLVVSAIYICRNFSIGGVDLVKILKMRG